MFSKILCFILISIFIITFVESNHQILKNETIIHLKFFDHYLNLFDQDTTGKDIRFKVSYFSLDSPHTTDENIEIFVLNERNNHFVRQQQSGHLYDPKEFVLISINVTGHVEKYPFIIEFYENNESNKSFGFSYLFPFKNTITDGLILNDVINQNKELIGVIKIHYLVIRPVNGFNADSEHMIKIKPNAMMGHRGTGVGRRTDLKENILENTIEAFNYGCRHKADMIELDIQLSKDKIAIINHDFTAKVLLREKIDKTFVVMDIPVKDLTYQQMTKISTAVNRDFDYADNQPFETLKSVLEKVEPKCGINFEIKYPQQRSDGIWEAMEPLELNEYIDIIVKTLYEGIGDRPAIITSFHADLCAMLHLKQNKFSVALLTSGDVVHWNPKAKPHLDPRATTIPFNTYFADGMQLNGLSIYSKDLLANNSLISFVKSHNQSVYVWGDQLNSKQVLDSLTKLGADGLIFDKIDKILDTTNPEHSGDDSGSVELKCQIPVLILTVFVLYFY